MTDDVLDADGIPAWSRVRSFLAEVALTAVVFVWSGFWLWIARTHLVAANGGGDWLNASFTVVVLVLPMVGLWLWHLASAMPATEDVLPVDGDRLPV